MKGLPSCTAVTNYTRPCPAPGRSLGAYVHGSLPFLGSVPLLKWDCELAPEEEKPHSAAAPGGSLGALKDSGLCTPAGPCGAGQRSPAQRCVAAAVQKVIYEISTRALENPKKAPTVKGMSAELTSSAVTPLPEGILAWTMLGPGA